MAHGLLMIILVFAGTVALAAFLTWFAARLRLVAISQDPHGAPLGVVGGLALSLMFGGGALAGAFRNGLRTVEVAGILLLGLAGLLSDRYQLPARWQNLAGLALAVALAYGATHELTGDGRNYALLGLGLPREFPVSFALLTAAFWGLPQAFKGMDGAKGLTLGTSLIALASLSLGGCPQPLPLAAIGAVLLLNWPRARLLLGNGGASALGLFLALLAHKALVPRDPSLMLWLFAYPITDAALGVAIRFVQGRRLGENDRSHLHHQWVDRWPQLEGREVLLLWSLSALCGSAVYTQGAWRVLPWIGLALLAAQALGFFVLSLPFAGLKLRYRTLNRREPLMKDFFLEDLKQ